MWLWVIAAVNWSSRSNNPPQWLSFSIRFTFPSLPSLYSLLPSRSTKVIDFICATQANIQSPQAPDLWSVKHSAVLILSPPDQCCIPRPASPLPPGNNGLSAWLAKWGVKWNGTWFVFHIFGVKGSCVCFMNLSCFGHCQNCLKLNHVISGHGQRMGCIVDGWQFSVFYLIFLCF